jgi:hypothetical protein
MGVAVACVGALVGCSTGPDTGSSEVGVDTKLTTQALGGRGELATGDGQSVASAIRAVDAIASDTLKLRATAIGHAVTVNEAEERAARGGGGGAGGGAGGGGRDGGGGGRGITGVRTSVNLADRLAGFTYAHDIGAQVPGTPDQPLLRVATVPGNPDRGAGASVSALFVGSPDFIGNPNLFGGFTFGMAASASQSPFVTVEQVPGTPDLTMRFAIGNPNLFPAGARIHLDLGPGNSVDLVKTVDAAGVSSIAIVPARR